MTNLLPTDEQLMAFADGELPAAEHARLARLVAADASLQARVESFHKTRELLRAARGPLAGQPVSDELRASIEAMIATADAASAAGPNVVSLASAQLRGRQVSQLWRLPAAASIMAILGGVGGYLLAQPDVSQGRFDVATVGQTLPSVIGAVLESTPSGKDVRIEGGHVRVIATLRTKSGDLCREVEVDEDGGQAIVGIGCRADDGWRLDIAVAAPISGDGFAPASSVAAIDHYLGVIDAGPALTVEEEAEALAALAGQHS